MTTQSEQFDYKLRSKLYTSMMEMQEKYDNMLEMHAQDDLEGLTEAMMELLDIVGPSLAHYFNVIEEGQYV